MGAKIVTFFELPLHLAVQAVSNEVWPADLVLPRSRNSIAGVGIVRRATAGHRLR